MSEQKMVPREPTQEMCGKVLINSDIAAQIWRAMWDAAPPSAAASAEPVRVCPVKDIVCSTPAECGQRETGCKMMVNLDIAPAAAPPDGLIARIDEVGAGIPGPVLMRDCRGALARSQEGEPVAWEDVHCPGDFYKRKPDGIDCRPLYAAPSPAPEPAAPPSAAVSAEPNAVTATDGFGNVSTMRVGPAAAPVAPDDLIARTLDAIDKLLVEAGYQPESSARHNLAIVKSQIAAALAEAREELARAQNSASNGASLVNELRAERDDALADAESWQRQNDNRVDDVLEQAKRADKAEADAARGRELLRQMEWNPWGRCPICLGWEVTKGQGERSHVHTKTCPLSAYLSQRKGE